jgi:hypothetical protein
MPRSRACQYDALLPGQLLLFPALCLACGPTQGYQQRRGWGYSLRCATCDAEAIEDFCACGQVAQGSPHITTP